jgi:hypothetical protein
MDDKITIDAARAAEIAGMTVTDLTAELPALDKSSLELVLGAEKAKGESDERTTAIAAVTAAIDAIDKAEAAAAEALAEANKPVEPVVHDGHTEMRNADGTGCSWRGVSYEPDENGVVTVPVAAAADLIDHGFNFVPAA